MNAGIKIDLCKFCGGEAEILVGTDGAEIRCSRCGITTGYIKDEDGFMEHVGGDMYIRHRTPKGINRAIDVWNNNPGSN